MICVLGFDPDEEAVTLANDTRYDLHDYVFAPDTARACETAPRRRTGGVGINSSQRRMEVPFGGMKFSCVGHEGGMYSRFEYVEWQGVAWSG